MGLNTEVKQDKVDKGDGVVEVQAVVVMSCSVTGYTKETFGQPQQQAFTGLIAEQASVPEDYVQITSIKEQAERRRLRASAYHRELAGSTLLVDFHIRSSPSQEIDEQQPGSSSNSAATLPLAAIIGIVFAVAIVVLVAVAVVMFAVVLPRVRESARSNTHEKEFETDPASFTTTETVLGSPKGIELGPVTRAPDRAMSDSSMAPNAEVKEEIDSQTAVNNADAVTVVTEGPVEPKETPDIAGPEDATEGAVELVVETGVNNSVGGDAVVHKIPVFTNSASANSARVTSAQVNSVHANSVWAASPVGSAVPTAMRPGMPRPHARTMLSRKTRRWLFDLPRFAACLFSCLFCRGI